MHATAVWNPVVDVRHDLKFDHLDLRAGTVEVTAEAGRVYTIETDASARGALMAGGGYGGRHGKALGRDHLESDVYPLDGTVTQLTLGSSLTDRLATFELGRHPRDRNLRVRADAEQVVLLPADARRVSGFRPSAGPCSRPWRPGSSP